ncbi:MAG: relaxase/mobilization nuclease domain-containing protein [Bacteroidetes bacterium]|nr:relaxase/mobilization nuclease domain-containing protein [Bacteroidota bacterium]
MVAVIHTSRTVKRVLNYNEKKVQRNVAELIHAENFLACKLKINFHEKINRFKNLNELNNRAKVNTLHVSVNFHSSEKIGSEKLVAIAKEYMQKIGFGDQPYLVYEHHDAGHPHLHIVSSFIRSDGKKIPERNLGRDKSFKACRDIEKKFSLLSAIDKENVQKYFLKPVDAKVRYGKSETKNAMQNVLIHVLNEYKYTSIPELNAVLQLYNMRAERGGEGSRVFKNNGLLYHALDGNGKKIGVPIKASDFYNKPTVKNLDKIFEENRKTRKSFVPRIKSRIDWTLLSSPKNMEQLKTGLQKENIALVLRQNEKGIIYGLTYVDLKSKCVLNGSDLGKEYSAKGMLSRFENKMDLAGENNKLVKEQQQEQEAGNKLSPNENTLASISSPNEILNELLKPANDYSELPYELRQKKKTKRKR